VQQRFVGNPVTGFVEELRNYTLHFRLPLTNARFAVATDPSSQEQTAIQAFVLDRSELMQWLKWTSKGKPYLEAADEEIVVLELVDQYYQEIRGFHDWMMRRLEEIHADEMSWLKEMEERVQKALHAQRARFEQEKSQKHQATGGS